MEKAQERLRDGSVRGKDQHDRIRGATRKVLWDAVCEGFLAVFSDLFMLSRGNTWIKTGSHFSMIAWFL